MTALRYRIKSVSSFTLPLGLFLVATLGVLQMTIRDVVNPSATTFAQPKKFIGTSVDVRVIRRLLGTRLVVADLIWIDTLIKDDGTREGIEFTDFFRAFKAIVTLDPDRVFAYYVAGLYLSVIKDDIKGATNILRLGMDHLETHEHSFKSAWRIPFTLGYNLIFEENAIDEGAVWIRKAAMMNGAPPYVTRLAERVATEHGRLELGTKVLTDLYKRSTRAADKAAIEKKMVLIAVRQELLDLNEKFDAFLSTTGAGAFARKRQFQLFLRSSGHSGKDMLGRQLAVDDLGKINVKE